MSANTMSGFVKICTFHFEQSGNGCDVLVNWATLLNDPFRSIRVEWDTFPPSPKDCRIWSRKYFPQMCRKLSELMPGGPVQIAAVNGYGKVTRIDPKTES
jgi:hypothetical protein